MVEVSSALWRKHRTGDLTIIEARVLVQAFEADFWGSPEEPPRFAVVAVTSSVLEAATALVATHALRAYDAVQLATALAVRSAEPDCRSFACFDEVLRASAATEGFELVPG